MGDGQPASGPSLAVLARQFWRVLIYSGAYLALVAAAEVLIVRQVLALPPSPAPLVGACITFAVYANDRIVDLEDDRLAAPRRARFVRRHRSRLYVLGALAYGSGAALSALGGPLAFGLALLPGAAWIVYAIDWIPVSTLPFSRLKEVPVVSSLVVAASWTLPVILVPLAFAEGPITPTVGTLIGYFLLATFVNAEVANVGDVEADGRSGVSTLPVVLGVAPTRTLLYGVTILTTGLVGAAVYGGYLTATAAAALSAGPVCLLGVVSLLGRSENDTLVTVAAECSRLPVLAVLLLAPFVRP